jgi:hypothetical protein
MNDSREDVDGRDKPGHDGYGLWSKTAHIFVLLLMPLGGCISYTPSDLALTSVEAVDLHDQAEVPGPGVSPLRGMVDNNTLTLLGEELTGGEKPHRLVLKVEFTSALDIAKYVTENEYPLGAYAAFCDHFDYALNISFVWVYSRGYLLGRFERDPFLHDASALKTYYIFVKVEDKARPRDIPPREAFDLRQTPKNVCLVLRGGNGPFGYKSNTVTIPTATIAAALREIPAGGYPK